MLKSSFKGYLCVMGAATLWGLGGVAIKFAFTTTEADVTALIQFRTTLTFTLLGVALALLKPRLLKIRARDLPFLALFGVVGLSGAQAFYYLSIREASVATAIFLQYLAPILTAAYEIVVQGKKPGPATFLVLITAVGGSALLLFGRAGGPTASALGIAAGLLSAACFAFYTISGKKALGTYAPWTVLFWGQAVGTLLWSVVRPPWVALATRYATATWLFFLYLAVLATAVPFGLFLYGLRHIGPTSATVAGSLEPVCAAVGAFAFLGETLVPAQAAGCVLILASIVALQTVPGAALAEGANERPGAPAAHPDVPAAPPSR